VRGVIMKDAMELSFALGSLSGRYSIFQ
jgi:hypothetical protein